MFGVYQMLHSEFFLKKKCEKVCQLEKRQYLCIRK